MAEEPPCRTGFLPTGSRPKAWSRFFLICEEVLTYLANCYPHITGGTMDPLSETDPGDKDLILSNEAISLVRLALSNQRDLHYLCTESS
jgi:hypothetical protein